MSGTVSGKLLIRVLDGTLGNTSFLGGSSGCTDCELTCKVEFDFQVSFCGVTVGEGSKFGESPKDAVLDVPEYHGATQVNITVFAKRSNSGWRNGRGRILRTVLRSNPFSQQKQIAQACFPLRDAIPHSFRAMARHAADAFDNGISAMKSPLMLSWWGMPSQQSAPTKWSEYWPISSIPLSSTGGVINIGVLFVPIISPEKSLGGFTELHKAAYLGDAKLVSVLLGPRCGSGACLASRTRDSLAATPLDLAAMRGHLEVALEIIADSSSAHLLFSHNVMASLTQSQSLSTNSEKKTSLHHAVLGGNATLVGCLADHFGISSQALKRAEDSTETIALIDCEDENGWTPLMMACERPDMAEAVTRLVEAGANMELVNKQGDTALLIACRNGNIACALSLLIAARRVQSSANPPDSKASLSRPNKANYMGDRALDRACASGNCLILVRALLDACAVPALRRLDGSTALHVAASGGFRENCEELVRWLERERARMASSQGTLTEFIGTAIAQSIHLLLIRDARGRFASDCAASNGHTELAEWLRQHEAKDAALFMPTRSDDEGSSNGGDEYPMPASGEEEKRMASSSSSAGGVKSSVGGEEEKRRA